MDKYTEKNLLNNAMNKANYKGNNTNRPKKTQHVKASAKNNDFKISKMSNHNSTDTQLLWNMQADVRAIGKLTALENVYGLKNRTQALNLLYKNALKPLLNKKGSEANKKFKVYYEGFVLKNKPKAEARYHKYHHDKK